MPMIKRPQRRPRDRSHSRSSSEDEVSSSFSSGEEEEYQKRMAEKRRRAKKHHKHNRGSKYFDSSEDEDDPGIPVKSDDDKDSGHHEFSRAGSSTSTLRDTEKKGTFDIKPLTDEELKTKYKYRRHKCKLADIKTVRQINGQEACAPGKPAELNVEKVKLHYVVHYINRGLWDSVVPEEGDREGKIDYYVCNVCQKRFKNHLERREYPGRGSMLCHIATDHGRLLQAMLQDDEVDMTEEIKVLALYDKQFNDTYRVWVENEDNSFGKPDDEIVTIKDSLIWKIYEQKHKEKDKKKAAEAERKKLASENSNNNGDDKKENNAEPVNKALAAVLSRPKPKFLKCPFCSDKEYKGTEDGQTFRLHFFHHYKDRWDERIKKLTSGDRVYYCDICPSKKANRGATPEGAKSSAICHLAIQHQELRGVLEKDDRLSKDFILDIYYDQDLKRAQSGKAPLTKAAVDNKAKDEDDDVGKSIIKAMSGKFKTTPKPKTVKDLKNKPGPKSVKRKRQAQSKQSEEEEEEMSFSSESEEDELPDLSDDEDRPIQRSGRTKTKDPKSNGTTKKARKASPDPILNRENNQYIRKRKPLNLTAADLEAEDDEQDWDEEIGNNKQKGGRGKTATKNATTRTQPRRNARRKAAQKSQTNGGNEFSDED